MCNVGDKEPRIDLMRAEGLNDMELDSIFSLFLLTVRMTEGEGGRGFGREGLLVVRCGIWSVILEMAVVFEEVGEGVEGSLVSYCPGLFGVLITFLVPEEPNKALLNVHPIVTRKKEKSL